VRRSDHVVGGNDDDCISTPPSVGIFLDAMDLKRDRLLVNNGRCPVGVVEIKVGARLRPPAPKKILLLIEDATKNPETPLPPLPLQRNDDENAVAATARRGNEIGLLAGIRMIVCGRRSGSDC
jgi:hypothetical protein